MSESYLYCRTCGASMFVTGVGVAHHGADDPPGVDFDADADHVAVPEAESVAPPEGVGLPIESRADLSPFKEGMRVESKQYRPRSPQRQTFLTDIIITAVEGGINYWAAVEGYRWYQPDLEGGTADPGPDGTANAYAVVLPNSSTEEDCDWWPLLPDGRRGMRIDADVIASALGKIRKGGVKEWGDESRSRRLVLAADRGNDAGELDANLADNIVQVALFGELVYA